MRESLLQLHTQPLAAQREWTVEGIPVLSAQITLPQPTEEKLRVARRIRRYYHSQSRAFFRYCEQSLLPLAAREYQTALAASAPLPAFRAELNYQVTYNEGGLWSLYTQSREVTLPGQTLLTRYGDTWDLRTGYPVALSAFFPGKTPWKRRLISWASAEIERQERAGIAQYRQGWRRLLRRHFNSRNFYLTEEGLAFFFPMYTVAPAMEGIPTFVLPYGKEGLRQLRQVSEQ